MERIDVKDLGEHATAVIAVGGLMFGFWKTVRRAFTCGRELIHAVRHIQKELTLNGGDTNTLADKADRIEKFLIAERHARRLTCNACGMAFMEMGPDGGCNYVSDTVASLAGMAAKEMNGAGWLTTIHPEDRERVSDEWIAAVEQKRGFVEQFRFMSRAGVISAVWGKGVPMFGRDAGEVSGFIVTLTQIGRYDSP